MKNSLEYYKTIITNRQYTVKEGRKYLNDISDMLLGADEKIKKEIVDLMLYLINDENNFIYFPFGEIIYFFEYDFNEFSENDKEKIVAIITKNFGNICNSENDMIPFILMDFIARHCTEEQATSFVRNMVINIEGLSSSERECLQICTRVLRHRNI